MKLTEKKNKTTYTEKELEEEIMYRVQRNIEKFNKDLLTKKTLLVKNLITNKEFEVHYYNKTVTIFQDNGYEGMHSYEAFLTIFAATMYHNIKENQHSGWDWK